MKLIVGLGNPGKEYESTRHNAGFMFIDQLAGGTKFSLDKKLESEILKRKNFVLVKPQTYMNDSGRTVRKMVDFYKISLDDLVVVHDDLDIELGLMKIQMRIGPKVHNGVNSVEQCLGSKDFWRVRLGIDNREKMVTALNGADYVLAKFGKEEKRVMEEVIQTASKELLMILGI